MTNFPYRDRERLPNYISWFIKKDNIFRVSLLIACILNLDKIILGTFSLIQVFDTFDTQIPFAVSCAKNILKYGFVSQSPQILCGISSFAIPTSSFFVLTQLFLPPYVNYLFHSIFMIFIAFLGMFLFLHDEFNLAEEASFIGSFFFCSLPILLTFGISVVGIPLLIWALERLLGDSSSFKIKSLSYFYIISYFMSSIFVMVSFILIPFYLSYFLFFPKNKKNEGNIVMLCLIWVLYIVIQLPVLVELFFLAPFSHRNYWTGLTMSWINCARFFLEQIFYIEPHAEYITMPSLLGLLIIIYYIISLKRKDVNKKFFFLISWVVFIEVFAFFICWSPLWESFRNKISFLGCVQFNRFYLLLGMLFAVLIGLTSNFLVTTNKWLDKRRWSIAIICIFFYLLLSFRYQPNIKVEIMNQLLCLFVFIILLMLKILDRNRLPIFLILLVPFLLLALFNTAYSRISYKDNTSYNHFFNSEQINKIENIEKNNLENFRVVKVGGYHPAQLMQNGFQCADGYANLYPQSYKEFWEKVIGPVLSESIRYQGYFSGGGSSRVYLHDDINQGEVINKLSFNPELLKLINVKYLFSEKEILKYEKYDLVKVAEKDPHYIKLPEWKKYFRKGEFFVYQNKDFAPQIFFTDSIKTFDNKQDLLDELGRRNYDYLKNNTFAFKESIKHLPLGKFDLEESKIISYRLTPDYVRVELKNRYPVILNWTRNYNKNWSCKIDGKESKIFVIYNSFIGTIVPANSHIVELRYRNIYLPFSYIISILGSILISIFVIRYCKKNSPI